MALKDGLKDGPLGFGTAPLGNMFRNIPDEEAAATVEAAWQAGTRYFDTAPFYGAGLSEIRLGQQLSTHNRDDYVLSTKVGRIVLDELETGTPDQGEKGGLFEFGRRNRWVYDYSEKGTHESIEGSLARLGVDRLDFVWIHDIAQDFHGDGWLGQFDIARTGAFRALTKLRNEGVIQAWGLGVNKSEPVELMLGLAEPKPDASLVAGRYTLLDHEHALQRLMPTAEQQGVDIVVGGPYSSGILAGGTTFEYRVAPPEVVEKCTVSRRSPRCSASPSRLQRCSFCLAHPAVAAIIPGASRPERIAEDHAAIAAVIPDDFWRELRASGAVSAATPLPSDG